MMRNFHYKLGINSKISCLCLVYFLVALTSMTARATSDSFLLKHFQPADISLVLMGAAAFSIILAILSTFLCVRYQAYGAMQVVSLILVLALFLIIAFVFLHKFKITFVVAYLICEVVVILPTVLFWAMSSGVLNPSESKKWFGLIGASGTCGCILAGYIVSLASKSPMVNELLLGIVALLLISINWILVKRSKLFKISEYLSSEKKIQRTSLYQKLRILISGRQAVLMTLLVVFSAMVLSIIDINFKFEVRKDEEDLYDFFGLFYTYTSVAQLILQLFVVRMVLTRGGVLAAISILPSLLILSSIGAILANSQDALYIGKFITQTFFFTIEYFGLQMLFLAVSRKQRGQMISAVDGLTRPATIAVISLLITYTLPFWQSGLESEIVIRLNLVIIFLCCLWLCISLLNYRQYLSSLSMMLGLKKIDLEDETQVELDPKFVGDLKRSFRNAEGEDALLLSEFALQMKLEGWNEEFRGCLDHDVMKLRENAIIYLARFEDLKKLRNLLPKIKRDAEKIQNSFIDSLAQSERKEKYDLIMEFLGSSHDQVICNAATTLMNSDISHKRGEGERIFNQYLRSENQIQRSNAIKALPRLKNMDTSEIISDLLIHSNPDKIEVALQSIQPKNLHGIFPQLLDLVQKNANRAMIFKKVGACGEMVKEIIDRKIRDNLQNKDTEELAALLAFRMETTEIEKSDEIEAWLAELDDHFQREILEVHYVRKVGMVSNPKSLSSWARSKLGDVLQRAKEHANLLSSIPDDPKYEALAFILSNKQKNLTALLSEILGILNQKIDFKKLFDQVIKNGPDAKSEVEEILKGVLNLKIGKLLMHTTLCKVGSGEEKEYDYFFEKLSQSSSSWYKCALLLAMSSKSYASYWDFVENALVDEDSMVRECGLQTLINHERNLEKIKVKCMKMRKDVCSEVVRLAASQIQIA